MNEVNTRRTRVPARGFGRAQWLIIPCLVFAAAELVARHRAAVGDLELSLFMGQAVQAARSGPLDYLFVGTSRVAAAIDAEVFADEVSRRQPRAARVVNMGTGYSTLPQHYLGLRRLVRDYPESLRGCVVFVEVPGGSDAIWQGRRWDEAWVNKGQAHRVAALVESSDLGPMWYSALPLADKLELSARFLGRRSAIVAHREALRRWFFKKLESLSVKGMSTVLRRRLEPVGPRPAADLADAGGIRTDLDHIEAIRQLAVTTADVWARDQTASRGWDRGVIGDIVRLVRGAGGEVVFFEIPLHSVQLQPLRTDIRQADRQAFLEQARAWGTTVLHPDFPHGDDDFPDIFHLARSRSGAFTTSLARAWMAGREAGIPAPERVRPN